MDFPLFTESSTFTDDSVLTFATAAVLLGKGVRGSVSGFRRYRGAITAAISTVGFTRIGPKPYSSYGNSAMRVSPVGFAADSLEETLAEARHLC